MGTNKVKIEELQDGYDILKAEMFELANKDGLSWWNTQMIEVLATALKVFKEYAEIKGITLIEGEDIK